MPFRIKFGPSIAVLIVAALGYAFEHSLGQSGPKYAILFLAPFMVVAMWVFPEVNRKR